LAQVILVPDFAGRKASNSASKMNYTAVVTGLLLILPTTTTAANMTEQMATTTTTIAQAAVPSGMVVLPGGYAIDKVETKCPGTASNVWARMKDECVARGASLCTVSQYAGAAEDPGTYGITDQYSQQLDETGSYNWGSDFPWGYTSTTEGCKPNQNRMVTSITGWRGFGEMACADSSSSCANWHGPRSHFRCCQEVCTTFTIDTSCPDDQCEWSNDTCVAKSSSCTLTPPENGASGDCTDTLASGSSCQPSCNSGYTVLGKSWCDMGTLTAATCQAKCTTFTTEASCPDDQCQWSQGVCDARASWHLGIGGEACADVCAQRGRVCDNVQPSTLTSPARLEAALAGAGHTCKAWGGTGSLPNCANHYSTTEIECDACSGVPTGYTATCAGPNTNAAIAPLCYCKACSAFTTGETCFFADIGCRWSGGACEACAAYTTHATCNLPKHWVSVEKRSV